VNVHPTHEDAVIGRLHDVHVLLRRPDDGLLMQRDRAVIFLHAAHRVINFRLTLYRVEFGGHRFDVGINIFVRIAAIIAQTAAIDAARLDQLLERVVSVIGVRRPAEQIEAGLIPRIAHLGEELRLGAGIDPTFTPTLAIIEAMAVQIASSLT